MGTRRGKPSRCSPELDTAEHDSGPGANAQLDRVAMAGEVASFSSWEMYPLVRSARLASSSWVRELIILNRLIFSPIFTAASAAMTPPMVPAAEPDGNRDPGDGSLFSICKLFVLQAECISSGDAVNRKV